jgi:hypothetical protein
LGWKARCWAAEQVVAGCAREANWAAKLGWKGLRGKGLLFSFFLFLFPI